jgi:hypothetical protein
MRQYTPEQIRQLIDSGQEAIKMEADLILSEHADTLSKLVVEIRQAMKTNPSIDRNAASWIVTTSSFKMVDARVRDPFDGANSQGHPAWLVELICLLSEAVVRLAEQDNDE